MASPSIRNEWAGSEVDGGSGKRESCCEIVAVAAYEPDAGGIATTMMRKPVMLDLLNPLRSCRRLLGRRRQARFDEMADTPSTQHG
jgi:hypothetical protein